MPHKDPIERHASVTASVSKIRIRKLRPEYTGPDATQKELAALLRSARGRCFWCRQLSIKLVFDHVLPLVRGGSNGVINYVVSCPTCNCTRPGSAHGRG
jgi:5-methylcytosine-specific restriction endonuclease McrA